ncbi:DsbC family protein [Marinobacter halodurans]|uniref:Thiol:disulfide interchange protein n=1 Tax=Marinobacter halodurans TaxID=2528979 RepID=A0ABY1ZMW8_9GAMM|nr:DsbC family protein [Marinobacter halodurans]TBW57843.1 DsbC family protein [Marinobacter halodurans]
MRQNFPGRLLATCLAVLTSLAAVSIAEAAGKTGSADVESAITQRLESAIPGLQVQQVAPSDIDGFYAVSTNNPDMIYSTADGQYFFVGDLYRVSDQGDLDNVTEKARAKTRAERIAKVDPADMITFSPKGKSKADIYVFTDIDCPYCRKLHKEVPRLNELGIAVHYLAYPRTGPNTPSFRKYVSVWCSDDPKEAMDNAKAGNAVPSKTCDNPVLEQYRLGGEVGVTGTPAIVLEDGRMVRGYVPSDQLAKGLGIL